MDSQTNSSFIPFIEPFRISPWAPYGQVTLTGAGAVVAHGPGLGEGLPRSKFRVIRDIFGDEFNFITRQGVAVGSCGCWC